MAAFYSSFINLLLVLLLQHFSPITSARISRAAVSIDPIGFSLELIHRDSSRSPLYDPSSTPAQQAENAALRSISRSGHFASGLTATPASSINGVAQSPVRTGNGDYLVTLSLGTPLHSYWAILDTGSDLTWTQCRPCDSCTGRSLSMFNPLASSTYKNQGCASTGCTALPAGERHCNADAVCGFRHTYGDGSSAGGDLASETLWFDAGVKFSDVASAASTTNAAAWHCIRLQASWASAAGLSPSSPRSAPPSATSSLTVSFRGPPGAPPASSSLARPPCSLAPER